MDHEKDETIKKLQIEKSLLVRAIAHVDTYIDKLSLEQDHIRSCLHDSLGSDPGTHSECTPTAHKEPESSQSVPIKPTPPPVPNKPVYAVMNEEENIEAINSQPLALDLDLDELVGAPVTKD